jgi:hypothetical protein
MIKLNHYISNPPPTLLRKIEATLENLEKISVVAKKIFYKLTITLALLCCSHIIASMSMPITYFTLCNYSFEILTLLSYLTQQFFKTLEKASFCFKEKLQKVNALPDLTDSIKLLIDPIHHLPSEVEVLINKYREDCTPYIDKLHRQVSTLFPSLKLDQPPKVPASEAEMEQLFALQSKFISEIKPFFLEFRNNFIQLYAYPQHLDYCRENRLTNLDLNEYISTLGKVLKEALNAKIILAVQEIVEKPNLVHLKILNNRHPINFKLSF